MARFRRGPFEHSQRGDEDPLAGVLAPPSGETPEERERRLLAEAEAQRRSDAIDEEINKQRMADRREPKHLRILLLGQSESGKSTTLKNFQLMNSPKAFRNERASWRAVVQLNVVRSIRVILNVVTEVSANGRATPTSMMNVSRPATPDPFGDGHVIGHDLLRLKMRLSPLQQVEEALLRKLSPPGTMDLEATHLAPATSLPYSARKGKFMREIAVHSNSQWKGAFTRLVTSVRSSIGSEIDFTDDPNDPGVILNACADDMIELWNNPTIKSLLLANNLRLEDKAGFFLDSLERVTALRYMPTDDDILRARLKTLGVSEHRFKFKNTGNFISNDWRVFDVGGARSLVGVMFLARNQHTNEPSARSIIEAAWAPYFDNMDAIIFLAPLSGFDEVLAEDPSTNKLEDSVLLWKATVSNPLLKTAQTVLFLNKMDIFQAKLESGIRFGQYVVSYGDKPNDCETASAYLRKKFSGIHKQHSPLPRVLYCHLTAVTDVKSTHNVLVNVKDIVLRQALENTQLV